ncbi:MAG: response regulator transcription factor [Chloroflexi bacterium]|nr:response regulator transcription factor [Chloroflexota bacterium]
MYTLCVLAPSGHARPALVQALGREGLAYSVVQELHSLEHALDAVLLDATNASDGELKAMVEQCQGLRLPVLMVLGQESVAGYTPSIGADDFILCPPAPGELTARVRQVLERGADHASNDDVLHVGDLVISPQSYDVYLAGRKVLLTYKEYQLLKLMAENPGRVFSRETLLNQVWGYDYFGGTRTVDVHIRRLRSKIEDSGHTFIETVWNVGYRFRA